MATATTVEAFKSGSLMRMQPGLAGGGHSHGHAIQPRYAQGTEGTVLVDEAFAAALDDIEGFERIWLIYWLDRITGFKNDAVPYRDTQEHGLFATRSRVDPTPMGMSVIRRLQREGRVLHFTAFTSPPETH
jgi:tRNA (Thr-GGU) A37 N-methylase